MPAQASVRCEIALSPRPASRRRAPPLARLALVLLVLWGLGPLLPTRLALAGDVSVTLAPSSDAHVEPLLVQSFNLPLFVALAADQRSAERWADAINTEEARLSGVLKAQGYLGASVRLTGQAGAAVPTDAPAFTMAADPGALYRIGSVQVQGVGDPALAGAVPIIRDRIDAVVGTAASMATLTDLSTRIIRAVEQVGFPYAELTKSEIIADTTTQLAHMRLRIAPGAPASFGDVAFRVSGPSGPVVLDELVPFAGGERYSRDRIDALYDALEQLPLTTHVRVKLAAPDAAGLAPVHVDVKMRPEPAALTRGRVTGIFFLALALGALVIRQGFLAAGMPTSAPGMRGLDIGFLALALIAGAFVLQRAMDFSAMG